MRPSVSTDIFFDLSVSVDTSFGLFVSADVSSDLSTSVVIFPRSAMLLLSISSVLAERQYVASLH